MQSPNEDNFCDEEDDCRVGDERCSDNDEPVMSFELSEINLNCYNLLPERFYPSMMKTTPINGNISKLHLEL